MLARLLCHALATGYRVLEEVLVDLLCYMLQQVQQFRRFGEVEAELRMAVLEAMPPEERLRGVSFDELILNLSEDQVAQLREALERRPGQKP
jgi:hypothetical protein